MSENQRILKIVISNELLLKCCIVDNQQNEILIQIIENENEYIPSVSYTEDSIEYCKKSDKMITFMKEWIEHPEIYTKYPLHFEGKQHEVVAEVLFGLIISEFKQIVEYHWNISHVLVTVPSNDIRFIRSL